MQEAYPVADKATYRIKFMCPFRVVHTRQYPLTLLAPVEWQRAHDDIATAVENAGRYPDDDRGYARQWRRMMSATDAAKRLALTTDWAEHNSAHVSEALIKAMRCDILGCMDNWEREWPLTDEASSLENVLHLFLYRELTVSLADTNARFNDERFAQCLDDATQTSESTPSGPRAAVRGNGMNMKEMFHPLQFYGKRVIGGNDAIPAETSIHFKGHLAKHARLAGNVAAMYLY